MQLTIGTILEPLQQGYLWRLWYTGFETLNIMALWALECSNSLLEKCIYLQQYQIICKFSMTAVVNAASVKS